MDMITESCVFKTIMSGALGFLFGFGIGSFFSFGMNPTPEQIENKSFRYQVIDGFKQSGKSGWNMGKGFASAGILFSGSECAIESYRGKSDIYGSVSAGCVSGALLGVRGGPASMAFGCAGFAAFSAAIDIFTQRHDSSLEAHHDNGGLSRFG